MSVITQAQKDATIRNLELVKQKLEAYGLDPKWSATTMAPDHADPALTYGLEKTDIQAALTAAGVVLTTWLT
jgi:Co/Zn/Cd efflux system component